MYIMEQVFVEFKVFKYEAEVKKVPYATCFPLTRDRVSQLGVMSISSML